MGYNRGLTRVNLEQHSRNHIVSSFVFVLVGLLKTVPYDQDYLDIRAASHVGLKCEG